MLSCLWWHKNSIGSNELCIRNAIWWRYSHIKPHPQCITHQPRHHTKNNHTYRDITPYRCYVIVNARLWLWRLHFTSAHWNIRIYQVRHTKIYNKNIFLSHSVLLYPRPQRRKVYSCINRSCGDNKNVSTIWFGATHFSFISNARHQFHMQQRIKIRFI